MSVPRPLPLPSRDAGRRPRPPSSKRIVPMFGIDGSEFLLFAVVALVVIGPKDLPKAMRVVGRFVGKARAMSRHFRSGIDAMIREAELEEMETKVEGGERADHGAICRSGIAATACRAACDRTPAPASPAL